MISYFSRIRFYKILLVFVILLISCTSAQLSLHEETYQTLEAIRDRKEVQLKDYLNKVQKNAFAIGSDTKMGELFTAKHDIYTRFQKNQIPQEDQLKLQAINSQIEDIYIDKYLPFRDVLFIDQHGDIFYTVRKKADYHKNIFSGDLAETALSKHLLKHPEGSFVDFENYQASGDPSAFFIVPRNRENKANGWYALEFSINKINEMFSLEEELGLTGEVFLVNHDRSMLTDSRFFAESTVLRQHLSEDNISAKFAEQQGRKSIVDYRNFRALTSFKVVQALGHEWLLIAKIDEDEIITKNYSRDSNSHILEFEKIVKSPPCSSQPPTNFKPRDIEVEMDEFRRVSGTGEIIYTHGVRTCLAVIISCPGKFAYLAHISANDITYGGVNTDLIGIMKKRIDDFDLVRSEKRKLQITIISPQPNYNVNIVDIFTDWGIFLSQIKLVLNPQARYANITHDYAGEETLIEWERLDKKGKSFSRLSEVLSLGEVMQKNFAL